MSDSPGTSATSSSDKGGIVTEQVKQQAQQAVGQTVQQASNQARSALDTQKDRGAEVLKQTSEGLRKAESSLQENNVGVAAQVVETGAQQVDRLANYLEQHSVNEVVNDVENYARRNSVVFLGGAFAAGVILARFLKSSPPGQGQTSSGNRGYSGPTYGAQRYGGPEYSGANYGAQGYGAQSYGDQGFDGRSFGNPYPPAAPYGEESLSTPYTTVEYTEEIVGESYDTPDVPTT